MNKAKQILNWTSRIIAVIVMGQSLFFKFSASAESIYIFTTVGMEPWGRIGVGVLELIASVLLLISATAWFGAGMALCLMLGAIGMHLSRLGIEVQGDGGQLFIYALIVSVCSAVVLWQNKDKVIGLVRRITG